MTNSNYGTKRTPSGGCDAEPEILKDHLGQSAGTADDLAAQGCGKQVLEATSEGQLGENGKDAETQRINTALDTICGMARRRKECHTIRAGWQDVLLL